MLAEPYDWEDPPQRFVGSTWSQGMILVRVVLTNGSIHSWRVVLLR